MFQIQEIFERYIAFRMGVFQKYHEETPSLGIKTLLADAMSVEADLDIVFPEDYRWWLMNHNLSDTPEPVYGINASSDDILRHYKIEHFEVENSMPDFLVPFCPDGWGNHYCFHKSQPGVFFWQHDMDAGPRNPKKTNDSFTDWFKERVDEYIKHNS